MKTFEFEGERYKEASEVDVCAQCAFEFACASSDGKHITSARKAFGGGCRTRRVIYILAKEQAPTPYAWAVTGCSQLFTGEYAEPDAKAWQKHVGGNTEAFPLYRIKENEK